MVDSIQVMPAANRFKIFCFPVCNLETTICLPWWAGHEESTDSDVTIFSSEEDEDCSESDSDEDGQLDDNSETNKKGALVLAAQNLLTWTGLIP